MFPIYSYPSDRNSYNSMGPGPRLPKVPVPRSQGPGPMGPRSRSHGPKARSHGPMVPVPWAHGPMGPWSPGPCPMVPWAHGPWDHGPGPGP